MRWLSFVFGVLTLLFLGEAGAQENLSITVTSPNGGECFIPGSEVTVSWTGEGYNHVAITHRQETGTPPTYQQDPSVWNPNHPIFGTSFRWQVPNVTSQTVWLWIEAHDASHNKLTADSSNNSFTIANTCGVDETPAPTAPQVTQIVVGDRVYSPSETIEVVKGTNLTLAGTAQADSDLTLYVKSEEKKFSLKADAEGKWSFDVFTSNLSEGEHQVDLESQDSPRAKAFSFKVLAAGQQATSGQESPSATPNEPETPVSPVRRLTGSLPLVPAAIVGLAVLSAGIAVYFLLRARGKRIDQTPVEPPQIS